MFFFSYLLFRDRALIDVCVNFDWNQLNHRCWCFLFRFFCWRQFGNIIMCVILLSKVCLHAYIYRCHSALISYLLIFSFLPPCIDAWHDFWCFYFPFSFFFHVEVFIDVVSCLTKFYYRCSLLLDLCTKLLHLKRLQVSRWGFRKLFWIFLRLNFPYCSQFYNVYGQALIQFTDAETASSARNALDGRSIPRHAQHLLFLLPLIFFFFSF